MLDLFKNSFKTANNSIIIIAPMILFILGIQSYSGIQSINQISNMIIHIITIWFIIGGFFAGWFSMVKKALSFSGKVFLYDKDRNQALKDVFKCFVTGFGNLFLPFLVISAAILLIVAINSLVAEVISDTLNNETNIQMFLIGIFIFISCISYWIILWIPEIVYAQKNPFKALINSTKKAFITFPQTIKLFLIMWVLFVGIKILLVLLVLNPFLLFITLLLSYYLIYYSVILVFTYYEQNFLK